LERRINEHNTSKLGARYTSSRRPVELVYSKKFRNRSTASKEENRIKRLSREEKFKIFLQGHVEKQCNTRKQGASA